MKCYCGGSRRGASTQAKWERRRVKGDPATGVLCKQGSHLCYSLHTTLHTAPLGSQYKARCVGTGLWGPPEPKQGPLVPPSPCTALGTN